MALAPSDSSFCKLKSTAEPSSHARGGTRPLAGAPVRLCVTRAPASTRCDSLLRIAHANPIVAAMLDFWIFVSITHKSRRVHNSAFMLSRRFSFDVASWRGVIDCNFLNHVSLNIQYTVVC